MIRILLFITCCCTASTLFSQSFSAELRHTINNVNCLSLAESPDGSYAIANKRFGIGLQILKRTRDGYELSAELFTGENKFPQKVAIGDGGKVFLVAFTDRSLKLYTRTDGLSFEETQLLSDLSEIPFNIMYSEAKKCFILADYEHTWIYGLKDGKVKQIATLDIGGDIHVSEDGQRLFVQDRIFQFTKPEQPEEIFTLDKLSFDRLHSGSLDATALSNDGHLYAVNDDRRLALVSWNGQKYVVSHEQEIPEEMEAMAFSPDGRYLFGGDDQSDRTVITIWKITETQQLEKVKVLKGFQDGIEKLRVSVDGRYMLTGTNDVFYCYALEGVKGKSIKWQDKPVVAKVTKPAPDPKKEVAEEPVKEKPDVPAPVRVNVFWINPNPDLLRDKPISTDKPVIEIQVKILSAATVKTEDVIILINGKELMKNKFNEVSLIPARTNTGEKTGEYTFVKNIPLQSGLNTIEISAHGSKAAQAVKVYYSAQKPSLHVLSIGTSLDLQFPKKDAEDFAALFSGQQGKNRLFDRVEVKKLIGKDAGTNAIKEAIEFYRYEFKQGSIRPNDVILIFLSSHGFMYQDKFRLQGDDYKDMYKETYSVAYDEIISRLNDIDCKKIIFLDACFSGGAKADPAEINEAIDQLNKQKTGTTTFSSCSRDEYSYEDVAWNNGAFTKALVEGCRDGRADADKNGLISLAELYSYTRTEVPRMVMEVKQKSQHPTMPVTDLIMETPIFVIE